jgi:predicted permease
VTSRRSYSNLFRFTQPDRLVTINNSYPGAGVERGSTDFFFRRERIEAFEEVAAYQGFGNTVGEAGSTERVSSLRVTPSFLGLLGVDPALGRGFTEEEMDVGNHQSVILTHGYWQEYFGENPDVLGRELRVDGQPFTVVGVLPEDFRVVGREDMRLLLPIPFTEEQGSLENWHSNNFQLLARLRPGATIEQARAQNQALNTALIEEWSEPNAARLLADAQYSTQIAATQDDLVRDVRATLYMLWAGVVFVLLIGCVNIANLMMARSQARMSEVATKLALGAGRARVARQVLTDAAVLGVIGSGLGIGAGALGLRLLATMGVDLLPRGSEISLNGTVLLFTAVLALGASGLFGIIPVAHVMRSDLSAVFRGESRTGTASKKAVLLRSFLVSGQVGLAFVMLIGAGLMFMSFRSALAVAPGFQPRGVFTASMSLPESQYPDEDARRQFTSELLREIQALPGVQAASATSQLPFNSANNSSSVIFPEDYVPEPGESILSPYQTRVGPEYFDALGIRLLEGRVFNESDTPDRTNVIILDEWLARRYWPESSPLGERMVWGVVPGTDSIPASQIFTVIGVVENIKQNDLTQSDAEHSGSYYFTYQQNPMSFLHLVARTAIAAEQVTPSVRQVLSRIAPEMPLFDVQSMDDRIADSLVSRRIPLMLLLVFAGVALPGRGGDLRGAGLLGGTTYARVGHQAGHGQHPGRRLPFGGEPRIQGHRPWARPGCGHGAGSHRPAPISALRDPVDGHSGDDGRRRDLGRGGARRVRRSRTKGYQGGSGFGSYVPVIRFTVTLRQFGSTGKAQGTAPSSATGPQNRVHLAGDFIQFRAQHLVSGDRVTTDFHIDSRGHATKVRDVIFEPRTAIPDRAGDELLGHGSNTSL